MKKKTNGRVVSLDPSFATLGDFSRYRCRTCAVNDKKQEVSGEGRREECEESTVVPQVMVMNGEIVVNESSLIMRSGDDHY